MSQTWPGRWRATRLKYESSLKGRLGWQGLKADEYRTDGPYVVSSAHFDSEHIQWALCPRVSLERYILDENIQLAPGDVLVMKDGAALGKLAFVRALPGLACLNSHLLLMRPVGRSYKPRYWFYVATTAIFQDYMQVYGTGATFMGVSQRDIGNFPFALPSFDEQTQIAKFLDYETAKIDKLIDKQQQLIALLKEKRQAVISHAVTRGINPDAPMKDSGVEWLGKVPAHWTVIPIKWAVRQLQTGCTPPTEVERYYHAGEVPWYGPSSFGEPLEVGDAVKLIHPSAIHEGKARLFLKGTVLVVGIGATIGKSALAESNCSANQQITALEFPTSRLLPEYAAMSMRRLEWVIRERAQYTTMPIVNQQEIGSYRLAVPSLPEQERIVLSVRERLGKVVKLIASAEEVVALLTERRSALISAAVTGKIDVRNWRPPETDAVQEGA